MNENYYKQYEPLFGSWYIKEKIGEGAFGQVYIIEREELGIVFQSALKAITIPHDRDEVRSIMSNGMTEGDLTEYYKDIVENVVNEFTFMSKLKGNSHIVSYEDHMIIEHEDDIGWDILIRLELLTPLLEYTYSNPMTEDDVVKLGVDICRALEFCRKYDIIHRDIKPENIFIAPSGDYKLGDFGIAKTVEKTKLGMSRKGTYVYMAPEVFKGEAYGPSVDIYSLGLVMYKFLNDGRPPFMPQYPQPIKYNDREEACMRRMRREQLPEPKNGSSKLRKIIMKACAYDSSERYSSPTQMREELQALLFKKKKSHLSGLKNDRTMPLYNVPESHSCDDAADNVDVPKEDTAVKDNARKSAGRSGAGRRKKLIAICAAVVLAAAGIAYAAVPKEVTDITGIRSQEEIYIGDTYSPKYRIEPDWFSREPLSFKAEDSSIITVSDSGSISAEKTGETVLTVSAKEFSRKVKIKVIPKVTDIYNIDKSISIEKGGSVQLKPKLKPEKFADEKIMYYTDNKAIATVDSKGKIRAKKKGSTKIRIVSGGRSETVKVEVYVYTPPAATYTAPQTSTYNSYSSGSSGSSYSSGSGSSSSKKSSSSSSKKSSGSDGGYFDSSDDEYF